jgi:hypothetical protein
MVQCKENCAFVLILTLHLFPSHFCLVSPNEKLKQETKFLPHHLLVEVKGIQESSLALVAPTVKLEYRTLPVGNFPFEHYELENCTAHFHFRCERDGSRPEGEEFIDACSTEVRDVEIYVTPGNMVVSAVLRFNGQVVAYASTNVEVIRKEVAETAKRYRNRADSSGEQCGRVHLINAIIEQRNYSSYLEIGTQNGHTFAAVRCEVKECVDPHKLYGASAFSRGLDFCVTNDSRMLLRMRRKTFNILHVHRSLLLLAQNKHIFEYYSNMTEYSHYYMFTSEPTDLSALNMSIGRELYWSSTKYHKYTSEYQLFF